MPKARLDMRNARIAIVSKRADVVSFFSLEAESFGFSTETYDRCNADAVDADLCVIDLQLIKQLPARLPDRVIVLDGGDIERSAREGATEICYTPFPMRLERLFAIYASLAFGSSAEDNKKAHPPHRPKTVCLCRSQDGSLRVRYNRKYILLSNYELKLLEYLCQRQNIVVSREELNTLLGATEGNIVDVYVCRLRKKLEEADPIRAILTVRSQGYKSIIGIEWE